MTNNKIDKPKSNEDEIAKQAVSEFLDWLSYAYPVAYRGLPDNAEKVLAGYIRGAVRDNPS